MGENQTFLPKLASKSNAQKEPHHIAWAKIPEKRKRRATWASLGICLLVGIGIIVYGLKVDNKVKEYKPVNDLSDATSKAILNGSIKCYIKEDKETYPVLFNLCFGLLAVILGTFVDRLSLIFEEIFHFKRRYKRNIRKMLKACFSGIVWSAVMPLFVMLILIISVALSLKKATLELIHITYILSGIGVGPLMMHLLNMNTQSDVHVSTILEEKETFVANGLAWSYYFNYLDNALPKFQETFPNGNADIPVQDQGEDVRLSSNKLILLISHDCRTTAHLEKHDDMIKRVGEKCHGKFRFPVYTFTYDSKQYRYVIKYVMQPLITLQKMSEKERIKALSENELEYQVEMFYDTLSSILEKPYNNDFKEVCILIPIKTKSAESLKNGGLVSLIMHEITKDPSTSGHDKGFMMVSPLAHHSAQPGGAGIEDSSHISAPDGENDSVTINVNEGTSQYSKQKDGHHSSEDDQGENSAKHHPVQEWENRDGASLESGPTEQEQQPSNNDDTSIRVNIYDNHKQTRKSKETQTKSPKENINMNDRKAATSGEPKETDSTNTTESQSYPKSCATNLEKVEDKQEKNEGFASKGSVLPISNSTEDTENRSTSSELAKNEDNYSKEPAENGTPFQSDDQLVSDSEDDKMNQSQNT